MTVADVSFVPCYVRHFDFLERLKRTQFIITRYMHHDIDVLSDPLSVNQCCLSPSLAVSWRKLLVSFREAVLPPIDQVLGRSRLIHNARVVLYSRVFLELVAHFIVELFANLFQVICPVRAFVSMNPLFLELIQSLFKVFLIL